MTFWTAHVRPGTAPVLVREGFSWGAAFFGPIWLAAYRAWIPAVLAAVAVALIVLLAKGAVLIALVTAFAVLLGLSGHDLRRWSLAHRGYLLAQIVTARDEIEALERLLGRRPDLKASLLPPEAAR